MKGSITAFLAVASYAVFGKILLTQVSPVLILVLNNFLAAAILILVLDLIKRIKLLKNTSRKDIGMIYIISIFAAFLGPLLFLLGLKITSTANAIFIGKSQTVMTTILAVFLLKEKIKPKEIVGAIVMFIGILILSTGGMITNLQFNYGDILVFLSGLSHSISQIMFKKYVHHVPAEVVVTLRNLFGAVMLFIISLMITDYSQITLLLSMNYIVALLGLVIITTILPLKLITPSM